MFQIIILFCIIYLLLLEVLRLVLCADKTEIVLTLASVTFVNNRGNVSFYTRQGTVEAYKLLARQVYITVLLLQDRGAHRIAQS